MKHGFIKVAAATPRVTVADCKANGEEILKAIHEMEKEHVKLMVFPEFCITGYTCHDLFLQRCLLDSAWDELLHIAEETRETDALIFVGLPLRHRGKLYNVAAALNHAVSWDLCRRLIFRIIMSFMSRDSLQVQRKKMWNLWTS